MINVVTLGADWASSQAPGKWRTRANHLQNYTLESRATPTLPRMHMGTASFAALARPPFRLPDPPISVLMRITKYTERESNPRRLLTRWKASMIPFHHQCDSVTPVAYAHRERKFLQETTVHLAGSTRLPCTILHTTQGDVCASRNITGRPCH